jgi:hypothetical protein
MKSIIVGFSRSRSIFKIGSKIIQEVEKRDFSHVFIRYTEETTGIELVSQASHGYVNQVNFDLFGIDNIIVKEYKIICTDEQFLDMLKFTYKNIGKIYSKLEICLIAIKKLFGIQLYFKNNDEEFICSQWAARICEIAGIDINQNTTYTTPSDLNELLKRLYG